jgi:hypothetical protein
VSLILIAIRHNLWVIARQIQDNSLKVKSLYSIYIVVTVVFRTISPMLDLFWLISFKTLAGSQSERQLTLSFGQPLKHLRPKPTIRVRVCIILDQREPRVRNVQHVREHRPVPHLRPLDGPCCGAILVRIARPRMRGQVALVRAGHPSKPGVQQTAQPTTLVEGRRNVRSVRARPLRVDHVPRLAFIRLGGVPRRAQEGAVVVQLPEALVRAWELGGRVLRADGSEGRVGGRPEELDYGFEGGVAGVGGDEDLALVARVG